MEEDIFDFDKEHCFCGKKFVTANFCKEVKNCMIIIQ